MRIEPDKRIIRDPYNKKLQESAADYPITGVEDPIFMRIAF
ncbi:MAG: hypothetical protein U0T81_10490 [Saprospiraceae bacterium]